MWDTLVSSLLPLAHELKPQKFVYFTSCFEIENISQTTMIISQCKLVFESKETCVQDI